MRSWREHLCYALCQSASDGAPSVSVASAIELLGDVNRRTTKAYAKELLNEANKQLGELRRTNRCCVLQLIVLCIF